MSRQYGLITFAQAVACGLSAKQIHIRVRSGRWERLSRGVYRALGAPKTWYQEVLAACFRAGDHAAASHVTAGLLWGLIQRRKRPTVEVTVPVAKHPRSTSVRIHRTRIVFEPEFVGSIPITSPARTVIDLAATIAVDELEQALDLAIRRHGVVPAELLGRLGRFDHSRGIQDLRRLVEIRAARSGQNDGVFASRFGRLLRELGLPDAEPEYKIRRGGVVIASADLCYPRERVVIELDDWDTHGTPGALARDNARQNLIEDAGYAVRRFTWDTLDRPKYVDGVIRRVLFERGHPDIVSV